MYRDTIILLLRYSDNHGVDTIKAHSDVINEDNFCWWAKLGKKQPSEKYLTEYLEQEKKYIILYTPGKLRVCECGGVLRERPKDHYPNYYKTDVFLMGNEPSVYFKLLSMKEYKTDFLADYIVRSSEKEVLYDLKKTISSYMFIQHKDDPRKPKKKPKVRKIKSKSLNVRDCIYRLEGNCTNKRCINYNYECLHPEVCAKQKIK